MIHSRKDYNRIQDPLHKIPADEPVFLLRAQDAAAPNTVRFWAKLVKAIGGSDDIVNLAEKHASEMESWQVQHGKKVPDMPKGES